MKLNRLLLMIFFCVLAIGSSAQRKELAQARTYIKSGKNLPEAEKLMRTLLADSANRDNKRIYLTLFEAVRKQYEQGNEKLYLRQKYDTANLFSNVRQMFLVLQSLDSIDSRPDSKGRVRPEYREKHAAILSGYRGNLFNGGNFYLNKGMYEQAFDMFDLYVGTAIQPLFATYRYDSLDMRLPVAASNAVYCGYKTDNPEHTFRHSDLARKDSLRLSYTLQYLADTYFQQGDTTRYVQILREGFSHEPKFPYFYPRLLDYYSMTQELDSAMNVADRLLAIDETNGMFLFAKSMVLFGQGKYAECVELCKKLIDRGDAMADAYYYGGLSYVNLAVETDRVSKSRNKREQVRNFYQQARPLMEEYRHLESEKKDKWAPVLYNIYLNLNMGKEFDEMDKLLK